MNAGSLPEFVSQFGVAKGASLFLAFHLRTQIREFLVGACRVFKREVLHAGTRHFESVDELRQAISAGTIQPDTRVSVRCRPSSYGPFLKRHLLTMLTGPIGNMRLGPIKRLPFELPSDGSAQSAFAGMALAGIFNSSSLWQSVARYPQLDTDTHQIFLYDHRAIAVGDVGFMGFSAPYISALGTQSIVDRVGRSTLVRGILRRIDPLALSDAGFSQVDFDLLRQRDNVWFVDLTGPEVVIGDFGSNEVVELWGALYATGRVEGDGPAAHVEDVASLLTERLTTLGLDCRVGYQTAQQEYLGVYAEGVRVRVDYPQCRFSVHADAELSVNLSPHMERFQATLDTTLHSLRDVFTSAGTTILNPMDVDFSSLDDIADYKVLSSRAANEIDDPTAVAVRDWHRRRQK